jgi:hypothetical protein
LTNWRYHAECDISQASIDVDGVEGRRPMTPLTRCLALVVLGAGGGEQGAAQAAGPIPAFESPFAFCARVGADDRLGSLQGAASGAALGALEPYLHEALGLPRDASLPPNEIFWRCMDGKVYVCARGANIPCDSKADPSKLNRGAANYCRENPNAVEVPAYAPRTAAAFARISGTSS